MFNRKTALVWLVSVSLTLAAAGTGYCLGKKEMETEASAVKLLREVERGHYKIVTTEELKGWIDSGKELDQETISSVFKENSRPDRDLKIGGIIAASAAPGLAVLGWFLRNVSDEAFHALLP